MTENNARSTAQARSLSGSKCAVVRAQPGELVKGYYSEYLTSAIPAHQIVDVYFAGVAVGAVDPNLITAQPGVAVINGQITR